MEWARPIELRDMVEPELGTVELFGSDWCARSTRLEITRAIILRSSSILGVSIEPLARLLAIDRARHFPTATTGTLGLSAEALISLGRPSTSGGQQG